MKKISTLQTCKSYICKEQKPTIGVDLGDRWSSYCVLDEAGICFEWGNNSRFILARASERIRSDPVTELLKASFRYGLLNE